MSFSSPVLILGMHRSGTSCLAGSLEEAVLYLGGVNAEADFNKKGNRENRRVMEHHDRILYRMGAAWDNPPLIDPVWTEEEKDTLKSLLSEYSDKQRWGLKDPRVLFMLDGWLAITLPKFVATFRHPFEVASSLVYRAGVWNQSMDMDLAYELWAAYNKKLLQVYQYKPFDIIRYDIDVGSYNKKLIDIAGRLGLETEASNSFREEGLHNQRNSDEPVPSQLIPIWEALNDFAF